MPLLLNSARVSWVRVVFAAFCAAFASLPTAGFGQPDKAKQPEQAAVAKEVAVVKSTFEREIQEAANDESAATKLVYELLSTVSATPDAVGKWALLKVAQEIAEEASGNIDAALKCATARAALFDVDLAKERNAVLREFLKPEPPANAQLFRKAMEASREALALEKFPEAREAAKIAADVAKALLREENDRARQIRKGSKGKVKPPAPEAEERFVLPAARLVKRILEAESLSNASRAAESVLRTSPDDMAAQSSLGEYTCFLKAAWADGLPRMAKNRNSTAGDIAAAELRARDPVDTTKLIEVADQWWELAKTGFKDTEVKREAVQRHAVDIYALVLPNIKKPLDEKRAKDRMTELGRSLQLEGDRDLIPVAPPPLVRPKPLTVPFNSNQAVSAQNEWARLLGIPVLSANSVGITLVLIPPGVFQMEDANKKIQVTITKPFLIGQTEVTRAQWNAVMKNEPWNKKGVLAINNNLAATNMTWDDAEEFCRNLTVAEQGLKKLKHFVPYRLPTEAEWEYAARAGVASRWSFGDNDQAIREHAWTAEECNEKNEKYVHPVALKKANAWGLHDVHGNVFEWCDDWFSAIADGPLTDPSGPAAGNLKVNRGGSFKHPRGLATFGFRNRHAPKDAMDINGFRIAAGISEIP